MITPTPLDRPAETACCLLLYWLGAGCSVARQRGAAWIDRDKFAQAAEHRWFVSDNDPYPHMQDGTYLAQVLYPDCDLMYANGDPTDLRECNILRVQRREERQ